MNALLHTILADLAAAARALAESETQAQDTTTATPEPTLDRARMLEAEARRIRRDIADTGSKTVKPVTNDHPSQSKETPRNKSSFVRDPVPDTGSKKHAPNERTNDKGGIPPDKLAEMLDLPLPGMIVEASITDGEAEDLGAELRQLMGQRPRKLTDHERSLIRESAHDLSPENIAALARWYPDGRGARRRKPDALAYILKDLQHCLGLATAKTAEQITKNKRQARKRKRQQDPARLAFADWLATADLPGPIAGFRADPATAWLSDPIQKLYHAQKAA